MTVKIQFDSQTLIKGLTVIALFCASILILWSMRQALTLILMAFFLALALNPPVSFLSQLLPRDSRILGTAVAYLIVLFAIGTFIYIAVPPLVADTRDLLERLPENIENVQNQEGFIADLIRDYNLGTEADSIIQGATDRLSATDGPLFATIGIITSSVISVLTVLVLTFLMLIEGPQWLNLFWSIYPDDREKKHREVAQKMYHVVTGYVNGQLMVAGIAASFSLVFMFLFTPIDPQTILPLAGIVGLSGLVPLIGTTIGSTIVIVVALFESVSAAVFMLVFFIVYQQIENNLIQPFVQSKTIDMSPLLVLVAVIFGFTSGGILGGFVAIPVAGIIRVLIMHYFEHRAQKEKEQTDKSVKSKLKRLAKKAQA